MAFVPPTAPAEPSTTTFSQLVASFPSLMARLIAENSGVVTLTAAQQSLAIQLFSRLEPSLLDSWKHGDPISQVEFEAKLQDTANAVAMLSAAFNEAAVLLFGNPGSLTNAPTSTTVPYPHKLRRVWS